MKKNIELLAPAGDWDAFVAAVENGADAVYLGGKLFNARQFAGNFDDEVLKKAIDYAHVRDVSLYLTMNTLLSDSELGQAVDFINSAYYLGIDAVIVQDLGLSSILRKEFPDLPLHASTQMTIYNAEGVKQLEQSGFSRVVLARELSLNEIKGICEASPVEIEVFVHGALCISYSGQCLMSSIIGGRSGNRGKCAQPCRLPYELYRDGSPVNAQGKYLLSPKDICSLEELKMLADSGVKSLKIEGRMKSPEYVATVVRIYSKYIDILEKYGKDESFIIDEQDSKDLAQIFNRGGFSKGYLKGKAGKDMMCCEKPKNWGIYLGDIISYDSNKKTIKTRLEEGLSIGDGIEVWNGENESPGAVVSELLVNGQRVQKAEVGQTAVLGSVKGRISKGNKIYKTSDKNLNASARESYTGKGLRKTALLGEISISKDSPITMMVADDRGNTVSVTGERIAEEAVNRPLTEERILDQVKKTGASPFMFQDIRVNMEEGVTVPVSEINDVRRKALEQMELKRIRVYERQKGGKAENTVEKPFNFPGNNPKAVEEIKISAFFNIINKDIDFTKINSDRIYLPFTYFLGNDVEETLKMLQNRGCEVFAWIPSITRGNYDKLIERELEGVVLKGISGILAGNIGTLRAVGGFSELELAGDFPLNVFNSASIEKLGNMGLKTITLSPELNLPQIKGIGNMEGIKKEALVYGRIPVMTSEYCPVGCTVGNMTETTKCRGECEKGLYKLKDRLGVEFPVACDRIDCRSTIFNSNVIFVIESLDKLRNAGIDMIRLNFTDEKIEEIEDIIEMHRNVLKNGAGEVKRYDDLVNRIRDRGFTKGHYFRGV